VKSRLIWIAVIVVAVGAFYYTTIRPTLTPTSPGLNRKLSKEFHPAAIPPPPLPAPIIETPTIPLPAPGTVGVSSSTHASLRRDDGRPAPLEVPIQNGATIDFSFGAPIVRTQGDDQAALEKTLKEMAEATKDITFPPRTPEKK
jgi:hypothetical protein